MDAQTNDDGTRAAVVEILDDRLSSLAEAALLLRQIAWNLAGPGSRALRADIEREADRIWPMIDGVAQRMAELGDMPSDAPRHLVDRAGHRDVAIRRMTSDEARPLVDVVFRSLVEGNRGAVLALGPRDWVATELLNDQSGQLELSRWLFRSRMGDGVVQPGATQEMIEAIRRQAGVL
ncbi:MAG: hypothetical protein KQH83_06410 [Actinobacteria bacterium]|nr:hypothetical protein [Actinomycetota bacterium]